MVSINSAFCVSVGLYGQNDREAAWIDMINDQQEDMRNAYWRLIYGEFVSTLVLHANRNRDAVERLCK